TATPCQPEYCNGVYHIRSSLLPLLPAPRVWYILTILAADLRLRVGALLSIRNYHLATNSTRDQLFMSNRQRKNYSRPAYGRGPSRPVDPRRRPGSPQRYRRRGLSPFALSLITVVGIGAVVLLLIVLIQSAGNSSAGSPASTAAQQQQSSGTGGTVTP